MIQVRITHASFVIAFEVCHALISAHYIINCSLTISTRDDLLLTLVSNILKVANLFLYVCKYYCFCFCFFNVQEYFFKLCYRYSAIKTAFLSILVKFEFIFKVFPNLGWMTLSSLKTSLAVSIMLWVNLLYHHKTTQKRYFEAITNIHQNSQNHWTTHYKHGKL